MTATTNDIPMNDVYLLRWSGCIVLSDYNMLDRTAERILLGREMILLARRAQDVLTVWSSGGGFG